MALFTVGIVGSGMTLWAVFVRPRRSAPWVREEPAPSPNRDLVSVAHHAIGGPRLSPLLLSVRRRLNKWAVASTGDTLDQLPGIVERLRRRPSARVRELRRFRRRLRGLERAARWRESAWVPRADPWRSEAESARRLRHATALLLRDLEQQIVAGGMEQT